MGSYKVPQNVEAEDKILGPLSLKQFIYALIGLGWGFLTFAIFRSFIVLWILIGVPPALFLLGLGLYQREDQPLETFVVAVIEFFTRPRVRLWQKEPIAEVFHLEPPPPKPVLEKRDPGKVLSQLEQLSHVVDTRGWSVKEPTLQEPEESPVIDLQDRIGAGALTQPSALSAAVPDVTEADDILDGKTAAAQDLNLLIENTVKSVHAEAKEKMVRPSKPAPSVSGSTALPSDATLKLATEGGDLTVAQIAAQARKTIAALPEGKTVNLHDAKSTTA